MDGSDLVAEVYQVMIHFLSFFDIKYNLADCPILVRATGHQSRPDVRKNKSANDCVFSSCPSESTKPIINLLRCPHNRVDTYQVWEEGL